MATRPETVIEQLPERIRARIGVNPDTGCWEWTGYRRSDGYGAIRVDGKRPQAHRVVYVLLAGEIPDGLHLDHLCRVHHCVNPAHLEPVTSRENVLRGQHPNIVAFRNGMCASGRHEMAGDNVQRNGPRRCCRACMNERRRSAR